MRPRSAAGREARAVGQPDPHCPDEPPERLAHMQLQATRHALALGTKPLDPADRARLLDHARARPDSAWRRGDHISKANNAHYTNTLTQFEHALKNSYNSLEGDVRVEDGMPVMAHDKGRTDGLTFRDWAEIGNESGRMLRIDLKEHAALAPVVKELQRLDVPDWRASFNIEALLPGVAHIDVGYLKELRAQYPLSPISLNSPLPLRPIHDALKAAARQVGGTMMTAFQSPLATRDAVAYLKPEFIVNAWNNPALWQPRDIARETARLRALGVDGMIDLRRRDDPLAKP